MALEASGACSCLHLVPSEVVPPRYVVMHLHWMLLDPGEFRLLSSWKELCTAWILQAGRWCVTHVGDGDGELEVLFKAALAFYPACLYSVFCSCPDVCDEDLLVGMWFSPHPMPFICLSLRDRFYSSLNPLFYQSFIFLGTLILLLHSCSNEHLSLCLSLLMQFLALSWPFSRFLLRIPVTLLWSASCIGCGWSPLSLCLWAHKTLLGCHSHVCSIILWAAGR